MKICFLIIATNKYIQFVEPLIQSIEQYALVEHDRHYLVFTDQQTNFDNPRIHVERITHQPWPAPSLMRYHYFLQKKDWIEGHDYCFYIDADMRVVAPVAEEILGDIVAVLHPGFWKKSAKNLPMNATPCLRRMFRQRRGRDIIVAVYKAGKANAIWSWLVPLPMRWISIPAMALWRNGMMKATGIGICQITHLHW